MSWVPGSLDGDGWAGSEDLALKVLSAEVRPRAWTLAEGHRPAAGRRLQCRVASLSRDPHTPSQSLGLGRQKSVLGSWNKMRGKDVALLTRFVKC